jgi:hypothetical protein
MNELSMISKVVSIDEIKRLQVFVNELWNADTELSIESVPEGLFVQILER